MYRPKKSNVEKLDRYVEKLKRHGILREDDALGTPHGRDNKD